MLRQARTMIVLAICGAAALISTATFAALLLPNIGTFVDIRSMQLVLAILVIAMLLVIRFTIHKST